MIQEIDDERYPGEALLPDYIPQDTFNEPLRLLLAHQQPSFREAIARFHKAPPSDLRRTEPSIDILHLRDKEAVEATVDRLLAQQVSAGEEGRFFGKSLAPLHCFVHSLYFEHKRRLRKHDAVVTAYEQLAAKLKHVDDFIAYLRFAVDLPSQADAKELQAKILGEFDRLLDQQTKVKSVLKTAFAKLQEEEQLMVRFWAANTVSIHCRVTRITVEPFLEQMAQALKQKPYRRLLALFIQSDAANSDYKFGELLLKGKLIVNYQRNTYTLDTEKLHPELRDEETVRQLLTQFLVKDILRLLSTGSIELEEKRVKLKYSLALLGQMTHQVRQDYVESTYEVESFSRTVAVFKSLLDHHHYQFVAIGENSEYFNAKYICKLFCLVERVARGGSGGGFSEGLLLHWVRTLNEWILIYKLAQQPFIREAVRSTFSLFHSAVLNQNEEIADFPSVLDENSQLSMELKKLILIVDQFPHDWEACKGAKKVVFGWGQGVLAESPEMKTVLRKMMEALLSNNEPMELSGTFWDFFDAPAISKPFKKMLSRELLEGVEREVQAIEAARIDHRRHPRVKEFNIFIYKLSIIISTKISFDFMDSIVRIIYNLYLRYAHVWPLLASFRLWILQLHHEIAEHHLENKIIPAEKNFKAFAELMDANVRNEQIEENTVVAFQAFEGQIWELINCLQLKKSKQTHNADFYKKYFELLLEMEQRQATWSAFWSKEGRDLSSWVQLGANLQFELANITTELRLTVRFFLCNSFKVLNIREQEIILRCIGLLYEGIITNPTDIERWKLINDLLGFSKTKHRTPLQAKQILGSQYRYTSRFNPFLRIDEFAPFNFLACLYGTLRNNFSLLLRKALFASVEGGQLHAEIWQNIEKLLFLPVNISGGCLFNGRMCEKSKEDMALGIYLEQYQRLTELLTEGKERASVAIVLELEKRKILTRLFETMRVKNQKIMEKARNNPPEHRFRARQQTVEEVIQSLAEMGVEREYAEIALENIDVPDQNLAMEWIDNNRTLVEEQLMMRVMEKSSGMRRGNSRPEEPRGDGINEANMERFRRDITGPNLRNWIKFVFKELFQAGEQGPRLKDVLFLCMDHLDENSRLKQYLNFNEKIYKDLDQLNKEADPALKLRLLISIMETLADKLPKARALFYEKAVNMKVISFLPRLQKEDQTRLFSLLNSYLPVITADTLTPELEEYLAYLLDLINQYQPEGKSAIHIFFKVGRCGRQGLMQRITRNIVSYLTAGLVKESIVPILTIVLQADRQLNLTNAELDLKTFLYQRYKHRINAFHPDKEHVLEIDIKEFAASFPKYDKDTAIYEVSKRLLAKRKNKNKYFYYDCRKEENAFGYSVFANSAFISFPLKDYQKTIVRSLLTILFKSAPEQQDQLLSQLHKVLSYFKILLPFALHERVEGSSLLEWLLECPSHSKRKYKLLLFLLLNSNIFVKKSDELYSYYSIADYACARVAFHLTTRDYEDGQAHPIVAAFYLQQLRKFSQFCTVPLSFDCKNSVVTFYEALFQRASSLQYLAISELLNIQYKRALLNNLKRKYKILGSESEPTFDRQFLNVSAFYNSLPLVSVDNINRRQQNLPQNSLEALRLGSLPIEDLSDSDEENAENLGISIGRSYLLNEGSYFHGLNANRRPQQQLAIDQLIVPLSQKPAKEGEEQQQQPALQPIVCVSNFTVAEVLQQFQQYLSFEIEVQNTFLISEAPVPQKIIKMPQNLPFKVAPQDGATDLDMRVKKNAGFERHFGEIIQVFEPKVIWEDKKASSNFQRRVQEISRRMFTGDNREEMMHHLQRLMINRESREEEAAQPPPRLLNATDIYNNVQQFTNPIVPVIQQQPKQAQQPPQQPQQNEIAIEQPKAEGVVQPQVQVEKEEEVPIEPVVNSEVVQNIPEPMEIEQPINQPVQIAQQPRPVVEQPVVLEPASQQLPPVQQPVEQPPQQVPVVPVVNAQNQPQPPIRDREILRVFGLPQTFLRDAGIDEESFDCLPEDFQQEQLMHIISQQNQAASRPPAQNNPNPNPNPNASTGPAVTDLQSDNVAFLASLDVLTRAQVLIEATPEFLSTLPANIREEAENYRHQQINRIIEEEEIEEERKMSSERPKASIVYPKVLKEEFSNISEDAAKRLFQGIFYIFPNFKLPVIKILLENKQTQEKALATIIGVLRYLDRKEENKDFCLHKIERTGSTLNTLEYFQWSYEETKNVRTTLLHTIYEHLKIPLYRDEEFLTQPLPTATYFPQLQPLFSKEENIYPQIELFEFALKHYAALTTELIKTIKDLPDRVLTKIVEGMRFDSLPRDFYDNLENFSDNARLKELFSSYFQKDRPKIEILGKLLRYNFSHVPKLRKIHEQALQYFSNSYYDFLNQIFRIYTVQTLGEVEAVLVRHKQIHLEVIKHLLQLGREIEKEPIGLLLRRPHLLDFETKKFIFRNHPRIRRLSRHRVHIQVDRAHLFQGSYNQLMSRSVRELEGRIQVSFVNEPGYDAGGLKREWFLVVSREIFNQDYALFEKSSSGSTYQPNPKSYINPDHLNYFKFIGRFIGKALVERELIDAYFTRAFYKMILGQELQFKDLQAQDYEFYKSMEWLKNNPIDENMFTFSYIYDNFGNRIEKELVPGGKAIIVNEQNKKDYIEKYCLAKMRDDFSAQVSKFLEGFHEIVPQECISYFEAKELELLISGVPEVDVEDLKKNTDYSGYTPTDQIIVWFWEVVEEYSQEDLAKLVQFITGTSKIPVEGFSQLVGMNGIQRISIHRDPCEHQLPKSHTCFNQLDLPNYPSKHILKQKLAICLAWGSEGFGFM